MKSALQSFSEKLLQASRDYSASLASMSVAKNQLPKIQDALHQAYREAAAVVDSFNPLTIVPSTGSEKPAAGLYTPLLSDSERRIGSPNQWTLRRDVRMATLNQLVSEGRLPAALATMSQVSPGDPLLIVLSEIISKAGFSLTNRSLEILATALKLRQWLDEIGIELALPDEIVIRQELEFLRLLSPFHHLSDEHFTGRKADLDVLRKYVGVADSSLRGNFFRLVIGILDLYKNKPLMIYGIGGMGKSTLIARFILEHTEQPMKRRFPFAYIDFDQPEVVAEEPITILAAIVRQVGMQSELIRSECEKLRREINEFTGLAIGDNTRESLVQLEAIDFVRSSSSSGSERQIFVQKFVRLFQQANTKNQPLLLILDTFEELQFHEPEHIPDLFHFLNILQQALPRLRVIIAGRRLEAEWCRGHELAPLTEDDAQEYLRGHGVPKDLSIRIIKKVGGNPLTLKLVVGVFKSQDMGELNLDDIRIQSLFFSRMDESLIQGQLFERILNHISDQDVRKLAHPGLVLHRITAELIQRVLAKPCGIKINSSADANNLLAKLGKEGWLIEGQGDALIMRNDLRRVMTQLLLKSEPEKVAEIHRAAVGYYRDLNDIPSRAEEIYHRYCLQHNEKAIDRRWVSGVEPYLSHYIREVPVAVQARLANRLASEDIDPEAMQYAEVQDQERILARKISRLMEHQNYAEAKKLFDQQKERTDDSPLFNLETVNLVQLGELQEARQVGEVALNRLRQSGNEKRLVELIASLASLARRLGEDQKSAKLFAQAAEISERLGDAVNAVQFLYQQSTLLGSDASRLTERETIFARLAELVKQIPENEMSRKSELFGIVGAVLEKAFPDAASYLNPWSKPLRRAENEPIDARTLPTDLRLALQRIIEQNFDSLDSLEKFLNEAVKVNLRSISSAGGLSGAAYDVINWAANHGRFDDLLQWLRKVVKDDSALTRLLLQLKSTPAPKSNADLKVM